jgi:hypothetical protein
MLTGWTRIPLLDEPQIEMIRAALGDDDFRVMYAEFPRAARKAAASQAALEPSVWPGWRVSSNWKRIR